jgi:hypothetical protein
MKRTSDIFKQEVKAVLIKVREQHQIEQTEPRAILGAAAARPLQRTVV